MAMIARVIDIDIHNREIGMFLVDDDNKICLGVDAYCSDRHEIELSYHPTDVYLKDYGPNLDEVREQKCIVIANINEIINAILVLFKYDKEKIKAIEFNDENYGVFIRFLDD